MAILMNVGKPLSIADNIFMAEWVAIFHESGLRDGVIVADLLDARLKLVLARARARELQARWMQEWRPLSVCTSPC